MARRCLVAFACLPALCLWAGPASGAAPDTDGQELRTKAAPFLKQYCFECHGIEDAEAHVNLERMATAPDIARDFKNWERVIAMLGQAKMPPDYMDQPSDSERTKLTDQIRNQLDSFVQKHAGDPGRVVMRRLTSAEYDYTIQDLTGLHLPLDRILVSDAVGGEGFTNVGDVQFVQDSTLERYLEAAKMVASHAVIGSGPLQFYSDTGQTGLELSAINRILAIYRTHGFRTAAGEGAEPFGLHRYPTAFFVAWQFRHRSELGLGDVTLAQLATREGLHVRFVEHVWSVVNEPAASFPISAMVAAWQALPNPDGKSPSRIKAVRSACDDLYTTLHNWQGLLASGAGDEEEAPVLTEGAVYASPTNTLVANVDWPHGAKTALAKLSVDSASDRSGSQAMVIWRNPRVRIRQRSRRRRGPRSLRSLLSEEAARRLTFGRHPKGAPIGENDIVLTAGTTVPIEFTVPDGATRATVFVNVELDLEHGDDDVVRCEISDEVEGGTAAARDKISVLLADPNGSAFAAWKQGALEFARQLPEVSQREPAPSDRDPIPAPWDNTYNTAERNRFHYVIKYHRDDAFLVRHVLDDSTRRDLDQAWTDLTSSFDYHDVYYRFVAEKFELEAGESGIADVRQDQIDRLSTESRGYVQRLHDEYQQNQRAFAAARPDHVDDALRLAERAWRRPLTESEQDALRLFYRDQRDKPDMDHAKAVRALIARVFVAPSFIYRVESPPDEPGIVALSDWEMANRLSYFLWSSVPDRELRRAARAGELQDADHLVRQARRMLRDPKARRLSAELFGQWFGFYRFDGYRGIDTGRFSEFTDSLKSAMHDEAVSFFDHIVREDRPVDEILFADYTFLNRELAQHYGVKTDAALTNRATRIDGVDASHRGGLLRLGAVLAVTSAPLRTSAVKRGDWILRRVLGTPVPPPPADVGSIPADDVLADGRTVRERLEAHRSDASCVNCHSRFDPLGFALEHFDPIGRWRDRYRDGQAIDSTGVLNDGTEISGLEGLRHYLQQQRHQFHRTLSTKLLGYALGRTESVSDRVLIKQMMADIKNDGRFSNLVVKVVTSRQFRHQRGRAAIRTASNRAAFTPAPGEN